MNVQIPQAAIDATAKALATQLAELTGQTVEQAVPFAQQWAPQAAVWASNLATAQQAGDTAAVARYQTDLKLLTDDAVLQAADYGVMVQGDSEATGIALLKLASGFLAQLAIASLVA